MKTTLMPAEAQHRPRWMIVDDNENLLSLTRKFIARLTDTEVECFTSPQAALAAFAAEPEAFAFVITDLEMPGLDGLELASQLRSLAPELNILLSTGSGLLSDEEAAQKGFCGQLHKPFSLSALKRAVARAGLKYGKDVSGFTKQPGQPVPTLLINN